MPRNNEAQETKTERVEKLSTNKSPAANATLLVVAVVLIALILLGGAFAAGRHWNQTYDRPGPFGTRTMMMGDSEFGAHRIGGLMNTSDRVVGVVTQVNNDHFTVASNGATKDVQTNGSTQYQGGSSVKVNDSVVVLGSTTNNQFTADQIVINP